MNDEIFYRRHLDNLQEIESRRASMKPPLVRYHKDPIFRLIVDTLRVAIENGDITASEVREAAVLAVTMVESHRTR